MNVAPPARCRLSSSARRLGDGSAGKVGEMHAAVRLDRRLLIAGTLLGVGLGGFVDGIVLHQILQWHHMLTSEGSYPATTVAGLETNTLWDGLFHATTWIATVVGLFLVWRIAERGDLRRSVRTLIGLLAIGWGLFNLVEGIIDHHILTIHHVRYSGSEALPYDLAFLAYGGLLLIGGWLLIRSDAGRIDAPAGRRGARPVS